MENIITLPVAELKTALSGLSKVINKSSVLPVLQSVRVCRNENATVTLQGTDLDSFVDYTLSNPQPGPACAFLAPLEALTKAVKTTATRDTISLVSEKDTVKLRTFIGTNPVDQKLDAPEEKDWPQVPLIVSPSIRVNSEFHAALKQAMECASDDQSRPILNGACLDTSDPKAHYVVASNGHLMYSANSFQFDLKDRIVIPAHKFLQGNALSEGDGELSVKPPKDKDDAGWVKLRNAHWTFTAKMQFGNYPNWRQVIPLNTNTHVLLPDEVIENLLEIVPRVPGNVDPFYTITLVVKGKEFFLEGIHKNDRASKTRIPIPGVQVGGSDVKVALNRQHLLKALRFGMNEIHLVDALTPVTCCNLRKRLVIATLRLEGGMEPDEPTPASTTTATAATQETTSPPATVTKPEPITTTTTTTPPQIKPEVNEERKNVSKNTTATESTTPTETKPESPMRTALEHIDHIKASLGDVIRELATVTGVLKLAEKEKKATDKEIEAIREKLREIQSVKI